MTSNRIFVCVSSTLLGLALADGVASAQDPCADEALDNADPCAGDQPPPEPEPPEPEAPAPEPAAEPAAAEAPAEEEAAAPTFTLSGFVNTTYNYNLNRPASGTNGFFSYNAQHNSLLLNAAHLVVSGSPTENLSWTVELDFGADARVNTYAQVLGFDAMGTPITLPQFFDVQEAYGVYKSGKLGLKVGKFVTYQGIEVIESPLNPTISRGYLFGLAEAFYHTGAVVMYQASDKLDVHVGVIQGWDVLYDTNRGKMGVVKVGITPNDKAAATVSAYVGPDLAGNDDDVRISLDATAVIKPSPKLDLWVQGNFGNEADSSWFGFGVQPVFRLGDALALGARAEFFKDDGARTGGENQLINVSVAPSYTIAPGVVVRAEARVDIADTDRFDDADGEPKSNQIVALADATISF